MAEQQHKVRVMQATALAAAMARRAADGKVATETTGKTDQRLSGPAQPLPSPPPASVDTNDAVMALLDMSASSGSSLPSTTTTTVQA
jgi:hypothetical protein